MLSVAEATRRVQSREGRLMVLLELSDERDDVVAVADALAAMCVGTDVQSGEYTRAVVKAVGRSAELIREQEGVCECPGAEPNYVNCLALPVLTALADRMFWLGFEMGREAED